MWLGNANMFFLPTKYCMHMGPNLHTYHTLQSVKCIQVYSNALTVDTTPYCKYRGMATSFYSACTQTRKKKETKAAKWAMFARLFIIQQLGRKIFFPSVISKCISSILDLIDTVLSFHYIYSCRQGILADNVQ